MLVLGGQQGYVRMLCFIAVGYCFSFFDFNQLFSSVLVFASTFVVLLVARVCHWACSQGFSW